MYNSSGLASSAIGSLLRKAQELKQQSPLLSPVSAEPGSPIREQVEGPIAAPESVGSEKIYSIKPGMETSQEIVGPSTDGGSDIITPTLNPSGIISPTGPVAPITPSPSVSQQMPAGEIEPQPLSAPSTPVSQPSTPKTQSLPKGTLLPSTVKSQPSSNLLASLNKAPTGTITQGSSSNKGATAGSGAAAVRGASLIPRAMLSIGGALATIMPKETLQKIKEGIRNPLTRFETRL